MRTACWIAIALCAGCTAEPAWEEGELGRIYEGLSVESAGGCSTFIVDGLSKQLIGEQNCIRPNALVSFAGKKGISIGSNVYPYLEARPQASLAAVGAAAKVDVTSAFRTIAQQQLLYRWYQHGQCGITLAAVPGNSNHETGIAVDVSNYGAVLGSMESHGWSHSYPSSDPVHYDYTAGGTVDLRHESVLAFQKLWNLNNPHDKIAEDGDYGPQTSTRIDKSPATGFAKRSTCTRAITPSASPDSTELQAELTSAELPQTLASGESVAAWVEFKNTGTGTWTPGVTYLGTIEPHDRESALAAPDWLDLDRPASVEAETRPGEIGRFSFLLRGPVVSAPQAITEHFGLVQEGIAWFPDTATVTADVEVRPAVAGALGDPSDSTEGGVAPTAGSVHGGCDAGSGRDARPTGVMLLVVALMLLRWRKPNPGQRL